MKRILLILLCIGTHITAGEYEDQHRQVPLLHYHDDFKDYYPMLSHRYELGDLPLAEPVLVLDRHQQVKATIVKTDSGIIPYSESLSNVTIEGVGLEPLHVAIKGFRDIRAQWAGSNLLYFNINIGHIASVECLLDVRERKWLYQKSISYNKYSEMKISSNKPDAGNGN